MRVRVTRWLLTVVAWNRQQLFDAGTRWSVPLSGGFVGASESVRAQAEKEENARRPPPSVSYGEELVPMERGEWGFSPGGHLCSSGERASARDLRGFERKKKRIFSPVRATNSVLRWNQLLWRRRKTIGSIDPLRGSMIGIPRESEPRGEFPRILPQRTSPCFYSPSIASWPRFPKVLRTRGVTEAEETKKFPPDRGDPGGEVGPVGDDYHGEQPHRQQHQS